MPLVTAAPLPPEASRVRARCASVSGSMSPALADADGDVPGGPRKRVSRKERSERIVMISKPMRAEGSASLSKAGAPRLTLLIVDGWIDALLEKGQ